MIDTTAVLPVAPSASIPVGMISRFRLPLLLLAMCGLVLAYLPWRWSDSADLAHHYSLVVRLGEFGNGAFPFDYSLGEMNVYPRLGHQLAVLAGWALGSPLQGLQWMSVFSLALLWGAALWLLLELPPKMAALTGLLLVALLWLNHSVLGLQLHGDELIGNFYYSQLLGQAVCLALLAVCQHMEARGADATLRLALMVPGIYLVTGIHLLPGLFLLAVLAMQLAGGLYAGWRDRPAARARAAGRAAMLLLAGAAALFLHPAFKNMREISKANGFLLMRRFDSAGMVLAYCVAIALVSALLLWRWVVLTRARPGERLLALKYVGMYGLAVSLLCLLQGGALYLGDGSEYAIKKYLFALNTIALFELALLPVLLVGNRPGLLGRQAGWRGALLHCALPAVLAVLACASVMPLRSRAPVAGRIVIEQQLLHLRAAVAPPKAGSYIYAMGLGDAAVLDYMMSTAIFRVPRQGNGTRLLAGQELVDWSTVAAVVTAEHGRYDETSSACRLAPPAQGLVALDGPCVAKQEKLVSGVIDFSMRSTERCRTEGLSVREDNGAWTMDRQVTLTCPLLLPKGKQPSRVDIDANAFLDHIAAQEASFSVDGQAPVRVRFDASFPGGIVSIPLAHKLAQEVVIRVSLPNASSPLELGTGADGRRLGLYMQSIEFK